MVEHDSQPIIVGDDLCAVPQPSEHAAYANPYMKNGETSAGLSSCLSRLDLSCLVSDRDLLDRYKDQLKEFPD